MLLLWTSIKDTKKFQIQIHLLHLLWPTRISVISHILVNFVTLLDPHDFLSIVCSELGIWNQWLLLAHELLWVDEKYMIRISYNNVNILLIFFLFYFSLNRS